MHKLLQEIVNNKRQEVKQLLAASAQITAAAAQQQPKNFKAQLTKQGLAFICEVKRKSPSRGEMAAIVNPAQLIAGYVAGGAAAVSVLTDSKYFAGSLQDCAAAAAQLKGSDVCVLRKEFIVDTLQIDEAIAIGADAILLIVAVLGNKTKQFLDYAKSKGIDAIVEVHTKDELDIAIAAQAEIIGVNNRNLNTFVTDLNNCLTLARYIPAGVVKVAESAIKTAADIKLIADAGYDAVLIGETLVTSTDPGAKLQELRKDL